MHYVTPPIQVAATSESHNRHISVAKGLAIILMVIGHSGPPHALWSWIYTFHMPLFFVASGYFFNYKYLDQKFLFTKKKIKGLYWPLVKWGMAFFLLRNLMVALHIHNDPLSFIAVIKKVLLSFFIPMQERLLGGQWFVLLLLYTSLALLFTLWIVRQIRRMRRRSDHISSGALIACSVLCAVAGEIMLRGGFGYMYYGVWFSHLTFTGLYYMLLGLLYRNFETRFKSRIGYSLSLAIIIIYAVIAITVDLPKAGLCAVYDSSHIGSLLFATPITLAVLNATSLISGKIALFLDYAGQRTMTILMLHFTAFLLITYIVIVYEGLSLDHLQDFPTIAPPTADGYPGLWVLYSIVGVSVPLAADWAYNRIKTLLLSHRVIPSTKAS